jgi:hypothetical protein
MRASLVIPDGQNEIEITVSGINLVDWNSNTYKFYFERVENRS